MYAVLFDDPNRRIKNILLALDNDMFFATEQCAVQLAKNLDTWGIYTNIRVVELVEVYSISEEGE